MVMANATMTLEAIVDGEATSRTTKHHVNRPDETYSDDPDLASLEGEVRALSVPEQTSVDGKVFPLLLGPVDEAASEADRSRFVEHYRKELLALVRSHGAVMLRGWNGASPQAFADLTAAMSMGTTDMRCSAGPRTNVARSGEATVFTANEAPPDQNIPFHHEMAQCDLPPDVVLFFCEVAARQGGATPLIKSHVAASYLRERHAPVAHKLSQLGVRYVRVMPRETDASSALGKSWKVCVAPSVEEAEAKMRAEGTAWKWLPGGMLHTISKPVPALILEERSGREVFFTAAESTFNVLTDCVHSSGSVGSHGSNAPTRPMKALIYGDGTELDDATRAALVDVAQFMQAERTVVPWQLGDVMLIDNASVMHARDNFVAPRRILASLVGQLEKASHLRPRLAASIPLQGVDRPTCSTCLNQGAACKESFCSPSSTMEELPTLSV